MSITEVEHRFKYIVVGDSGVGKSSLIKRYSKNLWDPEIKETIGVAFESIVSTLFNTRIKLHVWDTAGQERYRSLTKMYYRETMGIICVFDLTSEKSFANLPMWIKDVQENCDENAQIIILGNKSDLYEAHRTIPKLQIINFCRKNYIPYYEVSAKTGFNLNSAFDVLNEAVLKKVEEKAFSFYQSQRIRRHVYVNDDINLESSIPSYCTC
jgi:small GTP-binding protein